MIPQKALHLHVDEDKKKPAHLGDTYIMFEKHDGWYGYLDFPGCVIQSRAQREIPSLSELSSIIRGFRPSCKGRLIFEIMIEDMEIDSFHILNGILNRSSEQAADAYLLVHDYIPDFDPSKMMARKRYRYAEEIVDRLNMPNVRMSPVLGISDDPQVWKDTANELWEQGKEGVILKRTDAYYSPGKRNADLLKIKEELTLDLVVVGYELGHGKYADTIGALQVKDRAGNIHTVSGMTDTQRDEWMKTPSSIVGKVVEVKAMKKLRDGTLREPRFKAIRFDKAVEDID